MREIFGEVKGEVITIVNNTNTAIAAQSGSLPVFGTPYMIALMEKATRVAISDFIEDNETTVGTAINVSHDKASGVGSVVKAYATLEGMEGRKLVFSVKACEEDGTVIGKGTIERFVVDKDRFMKKVEGK